MSDRPKKGDLVRSSMAEEWLDRAWRQSDPDRQARLLIWGMFVRFAGKSNEKRGAHLGRPKGSPYEASDAAAQNFMDELSADTGETRPLTLAGKAIEAGKIKLGNTTKKSHAKRLAANWINRQNGQK